MGAKRGFGPVHSAPLGSIGLVAYPDEVPLETPKETWLIFLQILGILSTGAFIGVLILSLFQMAERKPPE